MMCIQTPGSFVFVYSLIVRPGVNWTAWTVYLISELFAPDKEPLSKPQVQSADYIIDYQLESFKAVS